MTEIDGSIGCNEFCFWGLVPLVDGKSVWQRMLIKKSVDVLRVTEILIQWDEVLPYNYTLLLVCDNRYKYSVEIFG